MYDTIQNVPMTSHCDGDNNNVHEFKSLDGKQTYKVQVQVKLVNGMLGECKVPSKCPLEFPVDDGITVWTPNQVYESYQNDASSSSSSLMGRLLSYISNPLKISPQNKSKKYIVLGCGKTGMDTVVFLQRNMGVSPDNITWIVPNDVWMLNRNGGMGPWSYSQALLANDGDMDKACLEMESKGGLMRLDPTIQPSKFRFPIVGPDELEPMRKVKNVIRSGRVTSIEQDEQNVLVSFGKDRDPLVLPKGEEDHVFIHCTSPGPFNGFENDNIFLSDKQINLDMLYAPPVPISMSCIAMLEAARYKGELDLEFGRKLLVDSGFVEGSNEPLSHITDNEILSTLVRPASFASKCKTAPFTPLVTASTFCALLGPQVALSWLKSNRLSIFSIPGFKGHIYENTCKLKEKYMLFGYTESEGKMFALIADRLKCLEGM